MKILHLLNRTHKACGIACAAVDLACTQAKNGHEVYVCHGRGDFDQILKDNGVFLIQIDQERKPWTLVNASFRLARTIRAHKLDIVHAHMMTSAIIAATLKPFLPFSLITTVHNEFQKSSILMGLGDKVIAVSEAVRQSMIHRGLSPDRVHTVLNGTISSPRFPEERPLPATTNHPAIVFVGGLHPRKGVRDLIEAFAKIVPLNAAAFLYIVGSGPEEDAYKKLAKDLCGERVFFTGHQDDPRRYLLASDIFVLPSYAEPAALVLSEARESGCAVIGTNVGGIPEMLDQGQAGILVPPGNPTVLAEKLYELIKDPALLELWKQKSQTNIEHLHLQRVEKETKAVYEMARACRKARI